MKPVREAAASTSPLRCRAVEREDAHRERSASSLDPRFADAGLAASRAPLGAIRGRNSRALLGRVLAAGRRALLPTLALAGRMELGQRIEGFFRVVLGHVVRALG